MAYTCKPTAQEEEAGGSQGEGHPQLHTEFIASLGHMGCGKKGIKHKQTLSTVAAAAGRTV